MTFSSNNIPPEKLHLVNFFVFYHEYIIIFIASTWDNLGTFIPITLAKGVGKSRDELCN